MNYSAHIRLRVLRSNEAGRFHIQSMSSPQSFREIM